MKDFRNQQGLAPIVVVILVAVLIVVGAVGYFVFARDDGDTSGSNETTSSSDEATPDTSDESSFTGTYLDAIERGRALQCQWRAPEGSAGDFQIGQGELYTDGNNRGYSVAEFEIQDNVTTARAIFDPDYIYYWAQLDRGVTTGFKMPASQLEAEWEGSSEAQQQQAMDFAASYGFNCEPWEVDESLFIPPSDITFTEITP